MTDLDLLKLKYQHELDTHLVLAINDNFFCYIKLTNSESKKINLIIKCASINFKRLGERKYDLWIMQVNSIQRANLTLA